jgi:predicted amidohydrolase
MVIARWVAIGYRWREAFGKGGKVGTPAEHLAERVLALGSFQADRVIAEWRNRGRTVDADADALARRWTPARELGVPRADQAGWSALEEMLAQRALDSLLASCHPDFGAGAPSVPEPIAAELDREYRSAGWWLRNDRALVVPRRRGPHGALFDADQAGPLRYSCCITGSALDLLEIVRLREEDEPDGVSAVRASHCAVAPVVGAAELRVAFERSPASGRWVYGPELASEEVTAEALEAAIAAAAASGARVLVCPEYSLDEPLLELWSKVLAERDWVADGPGLQWVLAGTGPVDGGPGSNAAVLLDRHGQEILRQPKTAPFDLGPRAWSKGWCCPGYGEAVEAEGADELLAPERRWRVMESRAGRVAVAICESLKPRPETDTLVALGMVRPSLILAPVFGKPSDDSIWERGATGAWSDAGADVVIANSVVVAEWRELAREGGGIGGILESLRALVGGQSEDEHSCAAWRTRSRTEDRSVWSLGGVPRRAPGEPVTGLALHPDAA